MALIRVNLRLALVTAVSTASVIRFVQVGVNCGAARGGMAYITGAILRD